MSESEQPPINDLQSEAIPNRRFVVLPSELTSPEDRAKMGGARDMARRTFPEDVLNNKEFQEQVNATIDIMATALVSTGVNYGEGDNPAAKLGRIYRENPGDMLSSIPIMYHNKTGTQDAMLGAQFVHQRQEEREPNYFTVQERLMLGLVSAADDLVFKGRRGLDEFESAETISAMMRKAGVFGKDMIDGVKTCITGSVFSDREGYVGRIKRELCIIRGIDPEDFPAELQGFVDSLDKIHKTGIDGDVLVLATRDSARRAMLHEMEGLWRIIRTPEERAGIVEASMDYFFAEGRAHEDLEISDIIGFIDANSDYRIVLGDRLQKNAEFVRTHQYEDDSLNIDLQARKGVNADFEEALGKAIVDGRMTVAQAYEVTMKYAGSESLNLVFTPEEDIEEVVNGEEIPKWSSLILAA